MRQGGHSDSFTKLNGVQQGGVISPLLFSLYIDNQFLELKQSGLGRHIHVGLTYARPFVYANEATLVTPSLYCLNEIIFICENYANRNCLTFNPCKSKILCYNVDYLLLHQCLSMSMLL